MIRWMIRYVFEIKVESFPDPCENSVFKVGSKVTHAGAPGVIVGFDPVMP